MFWVFLCRWKGRLPRSTCEARWAAWSPGQLYRSPQGAAGPLWAQARTQRTRRGQKWALPTTSSAARTSSRSPGLPSRHSGACHSCHARCRKHSKGNPRSRKQWLSAKGPHSNTSQNPGFVVFPEGTLGPHSAKWMLVGSGVVVPQRN